MAKPLPASEKTTRKDAFEKKKGVMRTPEEEEVLVGEVEAYVQRGLSRTKACLYLGIDKDVMVAILARRPDLASKLERAKLFVETAAEANVADSIIRGQKKDAKGKEKVYATENSKWYLERVKRNKYSKKIFNEQEGNVNLVTDNEYNNLSKEEKQQMLDLMKKAKDKAKSK